MCDAECLPHRRARVTTCSLLYQTEEAKSITGMGHVLRSTCTSTWLALQTRGRVLGMLRLMRPRSRSNEEHGEAESYVEIALEVQLDLLVVTFFYCCEYEGSSWKAYRGSYLTTSHHAPSTRQNCQRHHTCPRHFTDQEEGCQCQRCRRQGRSHICSSYSVCSLVPPNVKGDFSSPSRVISDPSCALYTVGLLLQNLLFSCPPTTPPARRRRILAQDISTSVQWSEELATRVPLPLVHITHALVSLSFELSFPLANQHGAMRPYDGPRIHNS